MASLSTWLKHLDACPEAVEWAEKYGADAPLPVAKRRGVSEFQFQGATMTLTLAEQELADSERGVKEAQRIFAGDEPAAFAYLLGVCCDLQHLVQALMADLDRKPIVGVIAGDGGDDELALAQAAYAACEEAPLA